MHGRSGSADGKMPVINARLQCRVGICINLALGHGLWEPHADLACKERDCLAPHFFSVLLSLYKYGSIKTYETLLEQLCAFG